LSFAASMPVLPISEAQDPPEAHRYHSINGQDAMHCAVLWIFQHCPDISGKPQVATQEHAWQAVDELFESTMGYKVIWDYMTMLRRKYATAERGSDGTIRLHYVDQRLHDFHNANRFISIPDSPEDRRCAPPFDRAEVITSGRPRCHRGKIQDTIPLSTYERQAEILRETQAHIWEFDPCWDLGR
jgi:hypothetical protein